MWTDILRGWEAFQNKQCQIKMAIVNENLYKIDTGILQRMPVSLSCKLNGTNLSWVSYWKVVFAF